MHASKAATTAAQSGRCAKSANPGPDGSRPPRRGDIRPPARQPRSATDARRRASFAQVHWRAVAVGCIAIASVGWGAACSSGSDAGAVAGPVGRGPSAGASAEPAPPVNPEAGTGTREPSAAAPGAAGTPMLAAAGAGGAGEASAGRSAAGGAGSSGSAGSAGVAAPGAGSASGAGAMSSPMAGAASEPAAPPCPTGTTYAPGNNRGSLEHQGRMRSYNVYVPGSVEPSARVPLVVDLHGNGSSGTQQQSISGWQQKADAESFLVAYPDGVGNAWNVGNCCGRALSEDVDDVGFIEALVAAVGEAACIDPRRTYATGLSNGAGLAHRLACEAADVFAAIAAASADLVTDPCTPARPISELSVRGESDTLVAYEGGNTGSTGWYSPGAKGTLELWKNINQCTGTVERAHEHCETYRTCAAGVEVTLCSLPRTGHVLYDNALDFDVPDVAWEMFVRQPMR